MGLFNLLLTVLLFVNSVTILNNDRFLKRIGLNYVPPEQRIQMGMGYENGVKEKVAAILNSARSTRFVLMFLNLFSIILLILFG